MIITKQKVLSSFIWKFSENFGVRLVQLAVQILLARLIAPEEFGVIILTFVFINIATVFVQGGLNQALIQNKYSDNTDYSVVFYINLIIASFLYSVLFFAAPWLSHFFEQAQLTLVVRVLAITLFLGAISSVQLAILSKTMQFKKQFISSGIATLLSSIITIWLAIAGYGVWALVVQHIVTQFLLISVLFIVLSWRPQLVFSYQRAKTLFSYGWKLLASALLDVGYRNSRNLVIGKMFDPATLAYYDRGDQFPSLLVSNINGSIQSVIFPSLAAHQDDLPKIKFMVRKSIQASSFFIFPLMAGMAVSASSIVELVLTNTWEQVVPFMQMACVSFALWPIHTTNLQAINALGRSDIFLKLEIIKKLISVGILIITINFGVHMIAFGVVISGFIGIFINAHPNKKMLNYGYKEQLLDILPIFLTTVVMGVVLFAVHFLALDAFWMLLLQIVIGVPIYIGVAYLFKLEIFMYLLSLIKNKSKRSFIE